MSSGDEEDGAADAASSNTSKSGNDSVSTTTSEEHDDLAKGDSKFTRDRARDDLRELDPLSVKDLPSFLHFMELFAAKHLDKSLLFMKSHERNTHRILCGGLDASAVMHMCAEHGEKARKDPATEPPEMAMCRLLEFGLDPDQVDGDGRRPIHRLLASDPELDTVVALTMCRAKVPDDASLQSPGDPEKWKKIREFFETMLKNRLYPSLAQLAYEKKWYAVKNLCRRRAVDLDEVLDKWRGKDALQWAIFYGKEGIANEILYLASTDVMVVDQEKAKALLKVSILEERIKMFESALEATRKSFRAELLQVHEELKELKDGGGASANSSPPRKLPRMNEGECLRTTPTRSHQETELRAIDALLGAIREKAAAGGGSEVMAELTALAEKLELAASSAEGVTPDAN